MNKLFFWVCAVLMTACASYKNDEVLTESGLSNSRFQTEINGEKTDLFVLKNKNKMEVCITNYGGRIVSVMVPDKDGIMRDVVLGLIPYRTISNIRRFWSKYRALCQPYKSGTFFIGWDSIPIASKQLRTLFAWRSSRISISYL